MNFTREKSLPFLKFKDLTEKALLQNPNLIRLDCLNPVKAMHHEFDFSSIPQCDVSSLWKNYLNVKFKNSFLSFGVRDSLFFLFKRLYSLNDKAKISIPSGVYPVYEQMLKELNVPFSLYPHFDDFSFLDEEVSILLITVPMFGEDISNEDIDILRKWLAGNSKRRLIIDRVYDYANSSVIQPLIDTDQTIVCYSLSKTHLSPLVSGFTVVPTNLHIKTHYKDDDKAKVLLSTYRTFPQQQEEVFSKRWKRMGIEVKEGYLKILPIDAKVLLKNGVLAIPGNVYGLQDNECVVSCLHESNDWVTMHYATVVSNFAKGYDKYTRHYSKDNIPESTYPNKFYLLKNNLKIGIEKAKNILKKTNKGDSIIIIRTKVHIDDLRSAPRGEVVDRGWIKVDGVFDEFMHPLQIEDVVAESMELNGNLKDWSELTPRSFSVLPIARACQAKCDFCFSHSSVSEGQRQGHVILNVMEDLCNRSRALGAERMVITGGGEPTMLHHSKLLEIMKIGAKYFKKIVMITNGYELGHAADPLTTMNQYIESGLSVLSISRHSDIDNTSIMHLDTKSERVAKVWEENRRLLKALTLRWICVLQKNGINDRHSLERYLDWVVSTGVEEVCFKELYVAATNESIYHDGQYNQYSSTNQVPLSLVVESMEHHKAEKISELPWGSPIYRLRWKGKDIKVAAYTEPNVFWERSKGICRSWNLMADGKCFANLETNKSLINLPADQLISLGIKDRQLIDKNILEA